MTIGLVVLAACGFVGSHLLFSHPLRRPVVARVGERGFLAVYSAVAAGTLGLLIMAYWAAPAGDALWAVGDWLWAVVSVAMLVASMLLMGSLIGNPALPTAGAAMVAPAAARGVFAITRHPMNWAFAIWAACHAAVYPVAANLVLCGAIAGLALVGSALQDGKKARAEPVAWPEWQRRTSFWPFVAVLQGRARLDGLRMHTVAGGLVLWLVATWAHGPAAGVAAGIWRWL